MITLTAGAENTTGTAGNDTINALAVKADGAAATTFSAFDNVDGGAGTDTLNIYTTATENTGFATAATVKAVEIVNIYNTAAAAAFGDASKFVGATQVWQHAASVDVSGLAATTTAGFNGLTLSSNANPGSAGTPATTATARSVTAASTATSATVALVGAKGDAAAAGAVPAVNATTAGLNTTVVNQGVLNVVGAALNSVTVSGTLAQAVTTAGAAAANLVLNVTAGKDVESLSVNTAVKTTLTVTESATSVASKDIRTLDASTSTGGITFAGTVTSGTAGSLAAIMTGAGADVVTITTATLKDDAATTTVVETVSASLTSGAGKDALTINTSGTGTTTVDAGADDDTVTLTADGTGILTVTLGAGNDTFKGAGSVAATDVVNGGDGTDTLLLSMVGSANIGAFSNFETFDAAALNKTLDVEILASKNTVTEFVASADTGGAAILTNIGAGAGFRVTGDTTVANVTTLTQKTAGALTITLDIDEAATTVANFDSGAKTNVDAGVTATNATSLKAVFDSAFKDAVITGDASDNLTNLTVVGTKATALEVVSGGAFAINDLAYTSGVSATALKDLLATVTISGDRALSVVITESAGAASQVTAINASALTGALTISTAELKAESAANTFDGGNLTLGSGSDVITVTQGSTITGFAKGSAKGATAQGAFDVVTGGATGIAADVAATATHSIKDGLFTFLGTGPATLAAAVTAVAAVTGAAESVVFEYVGNSYVSINDGGLVVKLVGVTGLTGLNEIGATDSLYVF